MGKNRVYGLRSRKVTIASEEYASRYWTEHEHSLFLEALHQFSLNDAHSIAAYINLHLARWSAKTPNQIRSHAQKWVKRVKDGREEVSSYLKEVLDLDARGYERMPKRSSLYCAETIDWATLEEDVLVEETEEPVSSIPSTPEYEEEFITPSGLWFEDLQLPAAVPDAEYY